MKSILILLLITAVSGSKYDTFRKCCEIGSNSISNGKCILQETPIAGVPKDEETICLSASATCCKSALIKKECEQGLKDAKSGKCVGSLDTERRQCCDACAFGKIAGASAQSCDKDTGLISPYAGHFKTCCDEVSPKSTTKPTVAKTDLPGLGNLCLIGEVCAQICIPTENSYRCDCKPGFTLMADGVSCKEQKQPISAAAIPKSANDTSCAEAINPCQQKCTDNGLSVTCSCEEGFELNKDQVSCRDIDECALGIHQCLEHEVCVNGEGYYDCATDEDDFEYDKECDLGYRYNGELGTCDDVDECKIPLMCGPDETCTNTIGSYTCMGGGALACPKGYHFRAATQDCQDIDECLTGAHDCNVESQICLNTIGHFACIDKASKRLCPPGFKMNIVRQECEDIDECLETPEVCSEDEECVNERGGYDCKKSGVLHSTTTTVKPTTTTTRTTTTTQKPTTTTKKPTTTTRKPTTTTTTTTTPKPTTTTTSAPKHVPHPTLMFITPTSGIPAYEKPIQPANCPIGHKYSFEYRRCVDIDECLENRHDCDTYQDCHNTPGSYTCDCKPGFQRDNIIGACQDVNECQLGTDNCQSGFRCDNTMGSYICSRIISCGTGYTLNYETGKCEDDDECALGIHNCGESFECRNTLGSYRCVRKIVMPLPVPLAPPQRNQTIGSGTRIACMKGYYLDSRGNCQDIDECQSNPCKGLQKCVNHRGRYECVPMIHCKHGYEVNEELGGCVDINECTRGTHSCGSTQICKNFEGFHMCLCPPGHQLQGDTCIDINECDYYKGRGVCPQQSYCINTIGSFKCECKPGFVKINNQCVDVDECRGDHKCQQVCLNLFGSYKCACERGYTLDTNNKTCTDINECKLYKERMLCTGECENTLGSYACRCPAGYRLGSDNRTCQDIDECVTNPCRGREAVCVNTRGGYECPEIKCPPNYVRDTNHKSRCKRICPAGNCQHDPEQYTFHFFSIASNVAVINGPIKFFQMKGPTWPTATAQFSLRLERVVCPPHVQKVTENYFYLEREKQKAHVAFVRAIEGPQEIELSFEMKMYQQNSYTGRVIARILIYVSKYSF